MIALWVLGYGVLELLGVLLAADAVMRPRSSQGAIAWAIGLVVMPVAGVPLYLLFGRTRFQGYKEALRDAYAEVGEERGAAWEAQMEASAAAVPATLEPVATVVRGLTRWPFVDGNRAALLRDGEATYGAMLEAIGTATSFVFVQFYIVRDDAVGQRFRDALLAKAQEGVRVCFLYDEIGCWSLPESYLETMRAHGIEVSGFRTTRGWRNRFQVNFRNHRKLLVVDGRVGFIGGLNLGEEYLGYRDTHLRLGGPAAQQILVAFLKDWYWATRRLPDFDGAPFVHEGDQAVAVVSTGPTDGAACCSVLFATLFAAARRRLWISSPYFVPDDVSVRALQAASLRGVDVRVILPGKADHRLVELASYTYYPDLLDAGVRMYRYQGRFMHQKVLLLDDHLAGVGTVKLDNRSLYLNFEATALVADRALVAQVEAMLRDDLAACTAVRTDHFAGKPLPFRIAARVARLASPLL